MTDSLINNLDLKSIRAQIDAIDEQLLKLFNQRAECAIQVAESKKQSLKEGEALEFFRPDREAQVIQRIKELNHGPLSDKEAGRLIREVMSACLALEQPLKIAYLGPEGTFTQAAALKHFGNSVDTVALSSIPDVFAAVQAGHADFGLVPVENSTEGVISHTLDMFIHSDLKVCGEVEVRIHHQLANLSQKPEDIHKIYSHQQSFAQCRNWLDQNLPSIDRIPVSSNGEAARIAAEDSNAAAICGVKAVDIFGLKVCNNNIEDLANNTTRFMVIGDIQVEPSGMDKTTILMSAHNQPGALLSLLKPLADYSISMNKIESRPSPDRLWEYVFFVDIVGHQKDENVAKALQDLQKQAALFKILGSYPKVEL
ncbi:MAG: prephenate dehydratase [Gammaproteobacteria bacterium]|nr:prephenate dehydratase [Gammaproteobacteria bacterium]